MEEQNTNEKKYPSVELAYDISLKTYDWAMQRSDSIDGTIDKLLAWISSITLGVIAIMATKIQFVSFHSNYFYMAIACFVFTILAGTYTKIRGSLSLITPENLYHKYLSYEQWEFKKNIIFWAGEDFKHNQGLVNWKGRVSIFMIIAFLLETIAIGEWLISL